MKELEDTHCEVRKIVELQVANWHYENSPLDDDTRPVSRLPGSNDLTNFMGGFLNDINYAWLSCGPKLVVFNTKTGVSISNWTFRERVSCVSEFPAQPGQIPLLLVGLDNDANKIKDSYGMVCIFDCTISQVLRAIRMPVGVEQVCIINGGAEWEEVNDERVDYILVEPHGMACIALRNIDHYIIDLKRKSWENLINFPLIDEANPAEIDIRNSDNPPTRYKPNKERHTAHNLMNERLERYIGFNRDEFESSTLYRETMTATIICSRKIGCLISGCLGRIIIWQNDGVVRWVSSPIDDNMVVSHLALLEPTDDPRPFCYLWVAYQEEAPSNIRPILRMYAMLFERKYSNKDTNLYFNLEGEPSLKFELEMEERSRITSLYPIVRENNQEQTESGNKKGEDNLLIINIEGKTVLFDLNQWYKEQMPRFIGECQNADAILSSYQSESGLPLKDTIISCAYVPSTLKEFPCTISTTPEELFFPNSLSLEWVELGIKRLTFWMTRGVQAQLLREMATAGPIIMIQPSETFHRCVAAGLIPFSSETSFNNTMDSQRNALLTLCLEQRWTVFLLKCAKEWSDGSAAYLYPAFLHWGIQRASTIQLTAHQLCIPLFDQSGSSIGEAEIRTLRYFSQQMECLCNVFENLSIDTDDLDKQRRTLRRISTYLQILLWFHDVGLLPETQDIDEESLPISFILKIPYPAEKLASIYAEKRKQYRGTGAEKEDCEAVMFIDELIMKECPALRSQWEQESTDFNHDGHYPPPSLQSLLRSCLIDCYHFDAIEMENKHQIIIYLLMDLVMLLQGSCPGVDQLIKYPSAFKLSPSLIKLTQAFWLLDHEDYQGFLDIMTGQLVAECDVKDWHHKLVMRTLLRSNQNKLALIYIRVRKPPLSSIDDRGTMIHLSVEHGLVQSAFHRRPPSHYRQLLRKFFRACKTHERLNDILHLALDTDEEEAFIQFLDEEKCEETRLIYYLQHSRYNEANNAVPSDQSIGILKKGNKPLPASFSMFHAYNATLPNITRRFSTDLIRRNMDVDTELRYPRPMSHYKSRVGTRDIYDTAIKKAKETFIRDDRSQIPFISAPCASLRTNLGNNESNCVLFVERARKPCAKRSLEEMKGNDVMENAEANIKKRRKISGSNDKIDETSTRQIGIDTVFGTPLVKRKNQIINVRDAPTNTPHSILKVRQMIRDSTSPSGKVSPSMNEKPFDIEKKPRQIRFSINQPNFNNSGIEETPIDNELFGEEIEQLETTESIKSRSVTPSDNSGDEEDQYFSPNANTKSLSESTVLTDSSSYLSKSLSGPRPRPGLRHNIDSPFDAVRKSSIRYSTITTESSPNSAKTSADFSITSNIVSSTFIDSYTPIMPHGKSALPSTSIYASTVLSSDTSLELSPSSVSRKTKCDVSRTSNSFRLTPIESSPKHDSLLENRANDERNLINNTMSLTNSRTAITRTVTVKIDRDEDDVCDENVTNEDEPMINLTDGVREGDCSIETKITKDEPKYVLPQITLANHHSKFNDEHDDISHTSFKSDEKNTNIAYAVDDDEESLKPSDDYDDELLALRYDEEEDDNDDVFRSLSNSMERDQDQLEKYSDKFPMQNNASKKTTTSRFYDEFNMTDDDSSRSVDQSDSTDILSSQNTVTNDAKSAPPIVEHAICDDANITDDKSDDSLDSLKLSTDCDTNRNINERSEVTTMRETSPHAGNDTMLRNEREESAELQISETKNHTRISLVKPISDIIPEEEGETSAPVRMTRSRRTSSVISIQEPVLDTPEIQKIERTLRASSLAKEIHSTPMAFGSDSSTESFVKRGKRQRSSSLIKDVLITSKHIEPTLVGESPVRRSTRRATSVQKDVPESMSTPTKNLKLTTDSSIIRANSVENLESMKKVTRSKTTSVNSKDIDIKMRKSKAMSVSDEIDNLTVKDFKPKRSRTTSVSSVIDDQIAKENSVAPRRTRAASVSKESVDKLAVKETKTKRTRAASVTKDTIEEVSNEDVPLARRTRAASVTKQNTKELLPKRKRAASFTSDMTAELLSRKTRAASLTKDIIEDDSVMPRRLTRASSLTKETLVDSESTKNRVTRRKSSTSKDAISESLRIRKGSIVQDIIPEEDVDEAVFPDNRGGTVRQMVGDASENHLSRAVFIPTGIEEEGDVSKGISKKKEKKGMKSSTRDRRATSVDSPQIEIKRRARGLTKSVSNEDHNGVEESLNADAQNKPIRKTTARRMTRAASETKELKDISVVERPKRGNKLLQTNDESVDPNHFQLPEQTRSVLGNRIGVDDAPDYVLSPPGTKFESSFSSQPRRPIANFISPLSGEEEKITAEMAAGKSGKSSNGRPRRRTSSMLNFRTKFVIRSQNNLK